MKVDGLVQCPFYRCERQENGMSCEIGKFSFPDKTSKNELKNTYCRDGYARCPFYGIMERSYDRKYERQAANG